MDSLKDLQWPLVLGLGALALVRPVMNIVGVMDDLGRPGGPLVVTLVVSLVWAAVVGLSGVGRPVLTLAVAGLTYGVLATALSGVLSSILDGELRGPLATPFAIGVVAMLLLNTGWGAVVGLLAAGLQRVTRRSRRAGPARPDGSQRGQAGRSQRK